MVSCGFQGRKYTTGHYWEGYNSDEYESQKLKQSESKNKSVLEYSVQSKELIEQDSMDNNSELDTLKIPLCRKKNHEALNNQVEVSDSLSPEMAVIKQKTSLTHGSPHELANKLINHNVSYQNTHNLP